MPAIKAPATVLVTGASGFIAAWVCKTLLEGGYSVRLVLLVSSVCYSSTKGIPTRSGTVRSTSKGEYLVNLFKSYQGRFKYVIVKEMAEVDTAINTFNPKDHSVF